MCALLSFQADTTLVFILPFYLGSAVISFCHDGRNKVTLLRLELIQRRGTHNGVFLGCVHRKAPKRMNSSHEENWDAYCAIASIMFAGTLFLHIHNHVNKFV